MHTFYQQELPFHHISLLAGNTVSVMFPANISHLYMHILQIIHQDGWYIHAFPQ